MFKKNVTFALFALLISCLPLTASRHPCKHIPHDTYTWKNKIPPRLEWNANFGYCGETSLISAGLYYGQYISQYEARKIASKNTPQSEEGSQLLLGVNDTYAATKMHLTYIEWDTVAETSTDQFLAWVKQQVIKGNPVAIGVYTNEYLFYKNKNPNAGDPDYDHIVPVYGFGSNHPFADKNYYSDDIIYFSDNGLWGNPKHPPFKFHYSVGSFQASRQQANAKKGSIYSLANDGSNYGIAITGVIDLNHDTVPVKLETNVNFEKPSIKNGSNKRPRAMPLVLTVTVSELEPGVEYNLYRYNSLKSVPDSNFNANADKASESWKIEIPFGHKYVRVDSILSNEVAVYRAVKATAP